MVLLVLHAHLKYTLLDIRGGPIVMDKYGHEIPGHRYNPGSSMVDWMPDHITLLFSWHTRFHGHGSSQPVFRNGGSCEPIWLFSTQDLIFFTRNGIVSMVPEHVKSITEQTTRTLTLEKHRHLGRAIRYRLRGVYREQFQENKNSKTRMESMFWA